MPSSSRVNAEKTALAIESDRLAIEECRRLNNANPNYIDYRRSLGTASNHLGILLEESKEAKQLEESLKVLDRAALIRESLFNDNREEVDRARSKEDD